MPRVGSCTDCGARFKVPDTTQATRAKCSKCGGVVEIPPAGDAAPAAAAAAAPAKAAAPARAAPAAPKKAAGATPRKARSGGAAAPRKTGSSGAASPRKGAGGRASKAKAGASGGRRKGGKGDGDGKGSQTGLIIGIVVVVALLGSGAWWFMGSDDVPATGTQDSTASTTDTSTPGGSDSGVLGATEGSDFTDTPIEPPAGVDQVPAAASSDPVQPPTDPAANTGNPSASLTNDVAAAASAGDVAPAPIEQAPAAAAVTADPDEPLPTIIEFDRIPALASVAEEDQEAWEAIISEMFIEYGGATGRQRKRLKAELDEVDPITAFPAFANAMIGVDLAEDQGIVAVFNLVKYWQQAVAFKPHFNFSGDVTDKSIKQQNLRIKTIAGLPAWWDSVTKDEIALEEYRERVEDERRKREG
jgi:hypothetical protein